MLGVVWKGSIPAKVKAQAGERATGNLMLLGCVQDKVNGAI